jgi:hypothetical protein
LLFTGLLAALPAIAKPTASNGSTEQLVGEWRGRSLCVTTARPACTDETVVYRITRHAPGTEAFDIKADKIVGGQAQFMGDIACNFEVTRQQLRCPMGQGEWRFRWDGSELIGALTEADKSLFRVIHVQKQAAAAAH